MIAQSFYQIQAHQQKNNYLHLEWTFVAEEGGNIQIQLPIWRPGRYQAQHFAKNIPSVYQFLEGEKFPIRKLGGSTWEVKAEKGERIHLTWDYFAQQEDAGGSVVEEQMLYINFITCCLFVPGQEDLDLEVQIRFPNHWKYLTSLKNTLGHTFFAKSFKELVDSPFLSAPNLSLFEWVENGILFKAGGLDPSFAINQKVLKSYQSFSAFQLQYMGHFPVDSYTYMHWICPKPYYHGVEHTKSTMIVLGDQERDLYEDLIGVASHELFHVWNICTIRPKELFPYQYDKEVIFPSGGVVEGITTYLGDWFLYASEVWSPEEYVAGLQGNLKLHFERDDLNVQSLVDSSIDLWLDGYAQSLPGKRVSIYYKGALMALGLDLLIRKKFNHQKSIRDVMLGMNEEFGELKKGYALSDFYRICSSVYEEDLGNWFKKWMESNQNLLVDITQLLDFVGLEFIWQDEKVILNLKDENRFLLYKKY